MTIPVRYPPAFDWDGELDEIEEQNGPFPQGDDRRGAAEIAGKSPSTKLSPLAHFDRLAITGVMVEQPRRKRWRYVTPLVEWICLIIMILGAAAWLYGARGDTSRVEAEPTPLVAVDKDHKELLRLTLDGTLIADWPAIGETCARVTLWTADIAIICLLKAIHDGQLDAGKPHGAL